MKPIRFYLPLAAFLFSALAVVADDLNLTNFTAADVGTPALAGTSTLAAGGVDITAGGLDIGASRHNFHFFSHTSSNNHPPMPTPPADISTPPAARVDVPANA